MSDDRHGPDHHEPDGASFPTGNGSDFRDRDPAEDLGLGEAVGRALRDRSDTVWTAPPVSLIEERAAHRARARTIRRTLAGCAVSAMMIVGGVVAWNMLDGSGTGTVVVSPDDPDTGVADIAAEQEDGTPAPAAEADDGLGGPGTSSQADGTRAAGDPPTVEDDESPDIEGPTPEELSTGPVLQWTEIDPGIADLVQIESVGDGRIIARSWRGTDTPDSAYVTQQIVVTTDGTDWTELPMPEGIVPDRIDISGHRWLVAGAEAGSDPFSRTPVRAFFSDDEGASWIELDLGLPPDPAPASPYVIENSGVTSALVSGENLVLAVSSGKSLDLYALLEGRGLVPEGKSVVGWSTSHSGSIEFDLVDGPEPGATPGSADSFEYRYGSTAVENMSLTYEQLGFTEEERAVFDDPGGGRVLVYAGDGSGVDVVAEYEGWAWSGVATDEGFILRVGGTRETILTSTDGRGWSEEPSLGNGYSVWAAGPGGTIWQVGSDGSGTLSIRRAGYGETPAIVATSEGLQPTGDLAVGPAGLITTAIVSGPYGTGGLAVAFPEGRVAKDGYELRYSEPEFGITLWDLEADTAVYVFGPEDILGDDTPTGVRVIADGLAVVFEDPETGADLVTFTEEDMAPILMPEVDGMTAPLTIQEYEPPDLWVGWSADGTAWGWQSMAGAFGIEDGDSWAEFAVGGDFVLARVQTIEVAEILGSDIGQSEIAVTEETESSGSASASVGFAWGGSAEPRPPRWFIGRVP